MTDGCMYVSMDRQKNRHADRRFRRRAVG